MATRIWLVALGLAFVSCGHVADRQASQADQDAAFARLGEAAFAAARAGEFGQARAQWREAHALRPSDPYVLSNLALIEAALGDPDEAVRHAARAAQLHALSPALAVNHGLVLEHAGMAPRAVAEYRRALELDPVFAPALLALGSHALAQDRLTQAARHFGDAVRAHPALADGYAGLAAVAAARKKYDTAAGHMAEAARRAPAEAVFQAAAGALYERAGDTARAKQFLDQAIALDAANGDALLVRAEIAWREGEYALAERHLARAAAADKAGERRAGSALRRGELAANLDRPAVASQALRLALAQAGQPGAWRGRAQAMLGELALRRGDYALAFDRYDAARALLGETPATCAGLARAHHGLALVHPEASRAAALEKAENWYRRSLEQRENGELRMMLGSLYRQWSELVAAPYRRGKLRQAEMQLRESLDHAPALARTHVELAAVLDALGRFGEAAAAYAAALERDPRSSRIAFLYADLLRREAERTRDGALMTRARAAYAQASRLDPRFAAAQLGWYLAVTAPTGASGAVTEETVVIPYGMETTAGVPPALEDLLPFLNGEGEHKAPEGVIPIEEGDRNPLYSIGVSRPVDQPAKTLHP